ncbi:hypothetical protein WMY93_029419 [Mugilogobius chulae]|uniref:Uncharacterized protein n=1 Tax=Mugilogobius chulae TaxID=88201 RepID=A0AAW0MSW8_9GOBI
MEATDREDLIQEANEDDAPPNGVVNEMFDVGQEDQEGDMQEQEEEAGSHQNVLSASVAAMLVYGVYMGHRPENDDGINVTPIIGLLYTPLLIRFLGTKWMMFLASGIYALFVSTNYWERYYTLVPSAVAIGAAIVPLWAMAQQYYEYVNYKEEHVQEQKKLPKGACHSYIIVFHSVFHIIFNLSFVFAQLPMRLVLDHYIIDNTSHILCKVESCGANVSGWIPGFNTSVLSSLPRSMLLIEVESFLVLCGPAYRPTEEIDLRSIGWGNIFQPVQTPPGLSPETPLSLFHLQRFEVLFVVSGFSLSYGVCALGLKKLWLIIVAYGLSASIFSSLSLCLLRLPRAVCLIGARGGPLWENPAQDTPNYLAPILIIAVLWGLGSALNKTGLGILVGMLYAEEKERLDFVYTIYHWLQAVAIFVVYLWSNLPMIAKLSILLVTLALACFCYFVMERRLVRRVPYRLPRIPRPRHKVKGYRYLEEDNSDESDSDNSDDDDDDDDDDYDREDETEDDEYVPGEEDDRRYKGDLDGGARGHDSPKGQRRRRRKEDRRERRRRDGEDGEAPCANNVLD